MPEEELRVADCLTVAGCFVADERVVLLRSETLLRTDCCPLARSAFVVVVTFRVEVAIGLFVVVVVVVLVWVGDACTRVLVVICLSPSTIRVVDVVRVVLPDVREVVVVVLLAVRLVVVTFPFILLLALARVLVVALVFACVLVVVRVAAVARVLVPLFVLVDFELALVPDVVELALVPDVEEEDCPREDIVRVEVMSRVPDNCLALVARVPL